MLEVLFVILILIIIIVLVFLYIFRVQIFGIDPNSSKEILLNEGYGYYSEPIISECTNKSGKCTETGVQIITQNCISNPNTGRGCIMDNGFQSFQNKITTKPCIPTCKKSIWSIIETSECINNELELYGCSSSNTGNHTIVKMCVPNDSTGINTCIYENLNNLPIPDGCILNLNTVICNIGSIYNDIQSCNVEADQCGEWLTIIDNQCSFPDHILPTEYCYDFNTGEQIVGVNNLFKPGFIPTPMHCSKNNCKSINCISDLNEINSNIKSEIPTIMCGEKYPSCVARCFYFSENVEQIYNNKLQELISKFKILTNSDNLFLTLNNTPCSINNEMIVTKTINNNLIMPPLSDCYADPNSNVLDTLCLMVESNIKSNCSEKDIQINSALFLTFKPTKYTNTNELYCNIIAILNNNFIGILEYDNNGFLYWSQHKVGDEIKNNTSEFLITFNGINYNIKIPIIIECNNIINNNIYCHTINNKIITMNNVNFLSVASIENINDIMELRSKRINGTGCNIFYSNIIPKSYIGT